MANFQGTGKAQSQGTAIATITGSPVLGVQSTSLSVSKGQGVLTQLNAGGITFTMTAVTGTFGPPGNPNAATAVATSIGSVSSLDTGRIGYVTAWGGTELGYAYTYSISGAPAGVSIDADMGILSFASPLAAGSYSFPIKATNRENPAVSASFPYVLTVAQGVTSGRTGTQVLHKTYDPHSGTWGTPTGNNWQTVFAAMATAILADQVAAGDGLLRATWYARAATTYQYTTNHFWNGIQYLRVVVDPAHNVGAKPIFQNIVSDPGVTFPYDDGPLNFGGGGAMSHSGTSIKALCAKIATVAAGSSTVTLLTPAQSSRIVAGRWHTVMGSCIQLGGYPPSTQIIDYVKVVSVNAGTGLVTLDRPLKYKYQSDWWEDPADDQSFGAAWLVPFDTGGSGGAVPADPRTPLRTLIQGINFLSNPNAANAGIILISGNIDLQLDNCTMGANISLQLTMTKHVGLFTTALASPSGDMEPDKQCETLFFDTCTSPIGGTIAQIGGATGFLYMLTRNCTFGRMQVSPRQYRDLNSIFDSGTQNFPVFTFAHNGPLWYYDFEGSNFKATGGPAMQWSFGANPTGASLVIGTDATWSGNQLRIPRSFADFASWLTYSYAGGIVSTTGVSPVTTNWGYISNVTSDGLGTALWLDIVWVNGTKPTSGNLFYNLAAGRRLKMGSVVFTAPNSWVDAGFCSTQAPPNANYDFPATLPPPYDR